MTCKNYPVKGDICGDRFRCLLDAAEVSCDTVMLVVRLDLSLSANAHSVINTLTPNLIDESRRSEWPGTMLLHKTARCLTFKFNDLARKTIETAGAGLYDWKQPRLPEDLSLYSRGELWFFSITHEREAYFQLKEDAYNQLMTRFPGLADILR